jgi:hypothetical protein
VYDVKAHKKALGAKQALTDKNGNDIASTYATKNETNLNLNSKLDKTISVISNSMSFANSDDMGINFVETLLPSEIAISTAYVRGNIEVITELSADGIRSTHYIEGKVGDTIMLDDGAKVEILSSSDNESDGIELRSYGVFFVSHDLTIENRQILDVKETILELQQKIALLESKLN